MRKRRVTVKLPVEVVARVYTTALDASNWVVDAVVEMLRSGELCYVDWSQDNTIELTVYMLPWLYAEVETLVNHGLYETVSDIVRGAVAKKLGLPCATVSGHTVASVDVRHPCGPLRLGGEWDKVRDLVACALRHIVAKARGRIASFDMRKFCATFGYANGRCLPITYMTVIFVAVKEVAGDCVVEERPKRGRGGTRRVLIDVACLKERICRGGCA